MIDANPPLLPLKADSSRFIRPFADPILDGYLRDIATWHGHIRFVGLPVLKDTGRLVPLPQLFVEPRLSLTHLSPEHLADNTVESETTLLSQLLVEHPRLVLLGDPGSGKSTIISWICDKFASFSGSEMSERLGQLVPIPLILRELTLPAKVDWESLLTAFLQRPLAAQFSTAPEKLRAVLDLGQAIILVDGLDEVAPNRRSEIRAAIWEGWGRHRSCRWLVTSRIVGYEQCSLDEPCYASSEESAGPSFTSLACSEENELAAWQDAYAKSNSGTELHGLSKPHIVTDIGDPNGVFAPSALASGHIRLCPRLYVAPFTSAQIREFASNWHRLRTAGEYEAEENARDLLRAISGDAGTKTLARVPNLLTLMALIHRQHATLPNGRALLFDKITEAYLESIDEARKLRPVVESSRAEKERWLADVAFQMQLKRDADVSEHREAPGEIRVPEEWLLDELAQLLVTRKKVDNEKAREESKALLRVIAERSGLLLPRGAAEQGEMWAFAHLSFQEYFAAQRLRRAVRSPGWSDSSGPASPSSFLKYAQHEVWRETFILLFESLAEDEAEETSWPDHLARYLFDHMRDWVGSDLSEHMTSDGEYGLCDLAIALFHNPHAGLNNDSRDTLAQVLWEIYFDSLIPRKAHGGRGFFLPHIAQHLLRPSDFHEVSLAALARVADTVMPESILVINTDGSLLRPLLTLKSLRRIHLFGCNIQQPEMSLIGSHIELWSLHLDAGPELDMLALAQLKNLNNLGVSGNPDPVGLAALIGELPNLRELSLRDVADETLEKAGSGLAKIKSLRLTNVTTRQLELLSVAASLEKLEIQGLGKGTDLRSLRNLPALCDLYLWLFSSESVSLVPLAGMRGLRVHVEGEPVWNAEMDPVP